ncbi:hypothetical protein TNIN_125531 [Trichonephila inaurata madagascariensis]|uniref:Uncharacterized protein n=1 Tax=Trichonephila inaurata madagascariensis TaxID=2747483 RepID=A0A8X6XSZ4_9ARAC|nr:hypothetical protein TNIN_125531 [Trichonephila inaurata madagascariensis]
MPGQDGGDPQVLPVCLGNLQLSSGADPLGTPPPGHQLWNPFPTPSWRGALGQPKIPRIKISYATSTGENLTPPVPFSPGSSISASSCLTSQSHGRRLKQS